MYMKIIYRKYVLYTLFYVLHKLLYLHSTYTYNLVRNRIAAVYYYVLIYSHQCPDDLKKKIYIYISISSIK
jgi:hypothetical protein